MTDQITIHSHPLFEEGLFAKHPSIFNAYFQNTPEYLKKKYRGTQKKLFQNEGNVTWPLIVGPGFSGATHPGAGKIFSDIMVGLTTPVHNSDCLYANPSKRIFAISDPPGITTVARKLIKRLDRYIQTQPIDNLEITINKLNKKTKLNDRATLTMIHITQEKTESGSSKAVAFIAGDTYLFKGNLSDNTMIRIEGNPHFLGNPSIHFQPIDIEFTEGDFFIIASDGLSAIRSGHPDTSLGDTLSSYLNHNPENFILNTMKGCNRIQEEHGTTSSRTWIGGSDNISVLLVNPDDLISNHTEKSFILGGYIGSSEAT